MPPALFLFRLGWLAALALLALAIGYSAAHGIPGGAGPARGTSLAR
ncbi:hypothetical protein [Methylobacterium sp. JK268]